MNLIPPAVMRLALPLLLALVALASAWMGGRQTALRSCEAQASRLAAKAQKTFVQEVQRGDVAVQQLDASKVALQTRYDTLERTTLELRKTTPLVVLPDLGVLDMAERADLRGVASGRAPGEIDQLSPDAHGTTPAGEPVASGGDRAGQPVLTRGAVWMWNAALAGADLPAGACSALDTSPEACAVDAGLGLEAAWDNHAVNAQSCALDRLRHQALIDYLNGRPK